MNFNPKAITRRFTDPPGEGAGKKHTARPSSEWRLKGVGKSIAPSSREVPMYPTYLTSMNPEELAGALATSHVPPEHRPSANELARNDQQWQTYLCAQSQEVLFSCAVLGGAPQIPDRHLRYAMSLICQATWTAKMPQLRSASTSCLQAVLDHGPERTRLAIEHLAKERKSPKHSNQNPHELPKCKALWDGKAVRGAGLDDHRRQTDKEAAEIAQINAVADSVVGLKALRGKQTTGAGQAHFNQVLDRLISHLEAQLSLRSYCLPSTFCMYLAVSMLQSLFRVPTARIAVEAHNCLPHSPITHSPEVSTNVALSRCHVVHFSILPNTFRQLLALGSLALAVQ